MSLNAFLYAVPPFLASAHCSFPQPLLKLFFFLVCCIYLPHILNNISCTSPSPKPYCERTTRVLSAAALPGSREFHTPDAYSHVRPLRQPQPQRHGSGQHPQSGAAPYLLRRVVTTVYSSLPGFVGTSCRMISLAQVRYWPSTVKRLGQHHLLSLLSNNPWVRSPKTRSLLQVPGELSGDTGGRVMQQHHPPVTWRSRRLYARRVPQQFTDQETRR